MPRSGQAVKVIVSLVGLQDTAVTAHRPGTDGAAVSVRVGGALIYINDVETAGVFHRAWLSGARQARSLPMQADPRRVMPVSGVAEPVVMMDAANSPPASARLERATGRPSCLWVTLGRVVFDVRDHGALRSTMAAFGRADKLAATTFPPAPEPSARDLAARTAARLFAPTGGSARPAIATARPAVAAAARPARAVRSTIERAV